MNCIYLKKKINGKLECKKLNKRVLHNTCANCIYKEYKMHNITANTVQKTAEYCRGMQRHKTSKQTKLLRKLERKRFSLFTDDLEYCYLCPKEKLQPRENLHEVIFGKNRQNSMKYGLVLPLCEKHHRIMHRDSILQLEYKKRGQALFEKAYPDLDFISIFRENYL